MKALMVMVAALALWAAVGCTLPEPSSPAPPGGGVLPPPEDLAEPGEATGAPATEPGGTGTVVETIKPDASAAEEPTAVAIPEASGWTNPAVPLSRRQEDIDACFSYAEGQIKREAQIDDDRYNFGDDRDFQNQYGLNTFRQRVDYYSERRRRGALFDACMQSKGYVRE